MIQEDIKRIQDYAREHYQDMLRQPQGLLKYPYIVPGSASYNNDLWDWDSWLTDIALRQIFLDNGANTALLEPYEKGCILNFLEQLDEASGSIPICIQPGGVLRSLKADADPLQENNHKPCLAQHAAFVTNHCGSAQWLREKYPALEKFVGFYLKNCRHESGLFFWMNDFAIGVDNDPCTFFRPRCSSASIYLNCLMFRELLAMAYLAKKLQLPERAAFYDQQAEALRSAINRLCWDERDGFYYSVDLALLPVDPQAWLHSGCPRHWNTLLQRIDVWSGFMALWAGVADQEQSARCALRSADERTFNATYGIRTLSRLEKMYTVVASGNPSCWLGPIWGVANYLTWSGLVRTGHTVQAKLVAEKTVLLFGRDLEKNGVLHEYYDPDTGEGVINPGFQNWNLLVLNMIAWLQGKPRVEEF